MGSSFLDNIKKHNDDMGYAESQKIYHPDRKNIGHPAYQAPTITNFTFTGCWRELLKLSLTNFLFNILTLGFYRFWGRTNVRRYLWSNIRFMDDPLEYTGEGKELFLGFLIALFVFILPVYLLIMAASFVSSYGNGWEIVGALMVIVGYLITLYLPGLAYYQAQKYRLSRTRWRGIRGSLENKGHDYATAKFGYGFLNGLTMGLTYPHSQNKLWEKETMNRRFGSGQFSYYGESAPLYKHFIVLAVFSILALVVYFYSFTKTLEITSGAFGSFTDKPRWLPFVILLAGMLCAGVTYSIGFIYFQLKKTIHFWTYSRFENCWFKFDGSFLKFLWLYSGNIVIIIFSLGILMPIAQMRMIRFFTENMAIVGDLDLDAINQSTATHPKRGEGLAESFDIGLV